MTGFDDTVPPDDDPPAAGAPSEASGPLTESSEIVADIARAVVDGVSGEWTSVTFTVNALRAMLEGILYVRRLDGTVYQEFPAGDTDELTMALRKAMYRPGQGTWFSATLTVSDSGSVSAEFDYDGEPQWRDAPPSPLLYRQDLESFPREPEAVPEWLAHRLVEAGESWLHGYGRLFEALSVSIMARRPGRPL